MIWVQVGRTRRSSIVFGGIYREHRQLGRTDPDITRQELKIEQELRWTEIIEKWSQAGRNVNCVVLGDMNLDYMKWHDPDQFQEEMVDLVQRQIELEGFSQIISGYTRSWPGQADSLLDHIWVNCPNRVVSHQNTVNGASDHNVVEVTVAGKDLVTGGNNVRKCTWRKQNKERCALRLRETDWSDVLAEYNVDVANSILEEMIHDILDAEAPMWTIQTRTSYNKWISPETKTAMTERDLLREVARRTQKEEDWNSFRAARNACTSKQRKNKQTFLRNSYEKLEEEKDTGRLFSITRRLLGWSRMGPPMTFKIDGQLIRKQKDIVNTQRKYYQDKVRSIKESIP